MPDAAARIVGCPVAEVEAKGLGGAPGDFLLRQAGKLRGSTAKAVLV